MVPETNTDSMTAQWLAGFIDGEGCFYIDTSVNRTTALGRQVQLQFSITQHSRDHALLVQVQKFLGVGYIAPDGPSKYQYRIRDLSHIDRILIPFLVSNPLLTLKRLDLSDFITVKEMMLRKEHLTQTGLDQIRLIKAGMNRARK